MEYEMSGGFREAREKREQNTDLNKIKNIDINAKYSEKSKKEKIKIHQHKNENNLIDEDERNGTLFKSNGKGTTG